MNNHSIWRPLNKTDKQKYLYHYTPIEKAIKIIYYETLQFGLINNTNDIFEQKPKLLFDEEICNNPNLLENEKIIEDYFKKSRERIKILCFSQDDKNYQENKFLTRDQKIANVIGRGFALPRMWAQYAENNEGICFIINKEKLIQKLNSEGFTFIDKKVNYVNVYSSSKFSSTDITALSKKIKSNSCDVISELIRTDSKYVKYNYFTKLNDWKTENEYRILIVSNDVNGEKLEKTKIPKAFDFIEGVVIGNNTDKEYCYILKKMIEDKCPKISVRQIVFDSMITTIREI